MTKSRTPYYMINREERHYAAILFMLLNHPGNMERILALAQCTGQEWSIEPEYAGIYFEYAALRDQWHQLEYGENRGLKLSASEGKKEEILKILTRVGAIHCLGRVCNIDVSNKEGRRAFNAVFAGDKASEKTINSPATWRIPSFANDLSPEYREEIKSLCMVKWAFKSKPDLVIQVNHDHVLCLELKLESIESAVSGHENDRGALAKHGLYKKGAGIEGAKQTEIQKFILEDIQGFNARYAFVSRDCKNVPRNYTSLTWEGIFAVLDRPKLLPSVEAAIGNVAIRT